MKRLFIADKPSKLKDQRILKLFKKEDCGIITRSYTSYFFNYPDNLKYKDLPFINNEVKYKYNQSKPLIQKYFTVKKLNKKLKEESFHMEDLLCKNKILQEFECLQNLRTMTNSKILGENLYSNKELDIARNKVICFIDSFDEIIIVNDSTISGIRAVIQYFEEYLGIKNFINTKFSQKTTHFFPFPNEEKKYLERKNIQTDNFYLSQVESYKKKDYFSYNFNTNSLVIIGDILRSLGCNVTKVFTMRMLQTLLLFKSRVNDKTLNVSNKLKNEDNYLFKIRLDNYMGDCHTTSAIDDYLISLGLITISENLQKYKLTPKALEFLSLLHPKMKDPKLSLKVGEDLYNSKITLKEFKEKYDKKIELMFKKQKRFSSTRKQI